jgi:DNA modification methylase
MAGNALYFGDNLDVLRRYIKDETVDLVYLDPPFNSNATYNVLFADKDGTDSAAQIQAFDDTWKWDQTASATFHDTVQNGPEKVGSALEAFRQLLGENDMLAYLTMMAPRLVELHRVMKPTGSLYLHCDPTASHYLKVLLDAVFGARNYVNEITWKRSDAHNDAKQGSRQFGRIHDTIFFYTKGSDWLWNTVYNPLPQSTIDKWYRNVEPETGRRFNKADLTAAKAGGDTSYEWKGVHPPTGRFWAYSRENMEEMEKSNRLVYSRSGRPYMKRYLDESKGVPLQDFWDDISMLRGIDKTGERLGYPTQKPQALLERIIAASSNEGDVVLDPFCGCGTAIAAAQSLGRKWIVIDITHIAVNLIKHRLDDTYGRDEIRSQYDVIGEPTDVSGAEALAQQDRFQFEYWALGLVGARPTPSEQKKGADKGIDGRLRFFDGDKKGKAKQIIFSVKSGKVSVRDVRDLGHVITREKAEIGVLITLEKPTKPMTTEAANGEFYETPWGDYPKLQILTIEDLIEHDARVAYPNAAMNVTVKRAKKAVKPGDEQLSDPNWTTPKQ